MAWGRGYFVKVCDIFFEQIPAIVNRVDDEKSAVFALIENLQRKDLNYFEEAQGIQTLMQTSGMSQQEVAKKLGNNKQAGGGFARRLLRYCGEQRLNIALAFPHILKK